jgi:hypothetical protein
MGFACAALEAPARHHGAGSGRAMGHERIGMLMVMRIGRPVGCACAFEPQFDLLSS